MIQHWVVLKYCTLSPSPSERCASLGTLDQVMYLVWPRVVSFLVGFVLFLSLDSSALVLQGLSNDLVAIYSECSENLSIAPN